MANRGKLLIVSIIGVAVVAAGVAWWHQYRQGQRVLNLWGADAAYRIRMAPQCTLLRLAEDQSPETVASGDVIRIGGRRWRISSESDISEAAGLIHARQALIQDASYDWMNPPSPDQLATGDWRWAIRFLDAPQGETLLCFDLERHWVVDATRPAAGNIQPISNGLQTFLLEQ